MIVTEPDAITEILKTTKSIAVLGIKTAAQDDQPSYYVPKYVAERGYDIIPIVLYYPDVNEVLGRPVVRSLSEVPPPVDMVNVFRRAKDLPAHLNDLIALKPKTVWLQTGIKDDAFAQKLSDAGITVVQDRCLMVELRARP